MNRFKPGDTDLADLPTGDLYFIFDGGRPGNEREYLRLFTGMTKVVKTILLHKEEASVQARMGKAMGIATVQLQENLMVVGGTRPECRKHSFQHFRGSSVGNLLGPITLPSFDDVWQVNWACKKDIYSASNLIGVGGKIACDAEDAIQEPEARLKPRTAATKEPVFLPLLPGGCVRRPPRRLRGEQRHRPHAW